MFKLSANAEIYIKSFLNPNQNLMITFKKGGCSGYQYKFDCINNGQLVNDKVFEFFLIQDVSFFIEKSGLLYIAGSILSYKKTQTGYLLYFENPKLSFCGCGKSFNL